MTKRRITMAMTMILIAMMTMTIMMRALEETDLGNDDVVQRLAVVACC